MAELRASTKSLLACLAALLLGLLATPRAQDVSAASKQGELPARSELRIPMRDGVVLGGLVYPPKEERTASCILAIPPYAADGAHDLGIYFVEHGFAFVSEDSHGRGSSSRTYPITKPIFSQKEILSFDCGPSMKTKSPGGSTASGLID